jgi:hypothetical protein
MGSGRDPARYWIVRQRVSWESEKSASKMLERPKRWYNQMRIALSILNLPVKAVCYDTVFRPNATAKNAWKFGISRKTLDVGPLGGIMESWEALCSRFRGAVG